MHVVMFYMQYSSALLAGQGISELSTVSARRTANIPRNVGLVLENIYKVVYNRHVGGAKWGEVGM